jgi:hypothetical protein
MKALLVVACLLVPSPASAALITLDFNVFSGNYQYTFEGRDAYRQDVYTPQHGIAMPGVLMFDSLFAQMFNDALAANYTTNGTGIGAIPLNGTILSTGQPFTLLAFDLLPHWPAESAGADVRLTGMRGDATTGSLLITGRDSHTWRTISGESLGLVDHVLIETVNRGPSAQEFWIDNLRLDRPDAIAMSVATQTASVPTANTLLLLLSGIGVSLLRRRSH